MYMYMYWLNLLVRRDFVTREMDCARAEIPGEGKGTMSCTLTRTHAEFAVANDKTFNININNFINCLMFQLCCFIT